MSRASNERFAHRAQKSARRTRFQYPGASTNPLSAKQKGIVCKIARRAFEFRREKGTFEDWRREQQSLAVGIGSLTECTQENYLDLVAHFEGLAGAGDRQFEASHRSLDEEKRQARHKLEEALDDRRLDLSYAEKICRDQYKHGLDDATATQLWNIKFTVEQRRAQVAEDAATQPF